MLGLGNSIVSGSPSQRLIATYTSDFSSGVDSWAAYSVQGTLTLAGNQDGVDGEDDWLKGTFDTNQTSGPSGISRPNTFTDVRLGDQFSISLKIRIISGSDHWDGSDDVLTYLYPVGSDNVSPPNYLYHTFNAVQDATTTSDSGIINVSVFSVSDTSGDLGDISIRWLLSGDKPKAGAVFYVKDIVVKQYRTS